VAYPRFVRSRQFKFVNATAGTTSINTAAAWANLSTYIASFTDVTLTEVQVGDVIEVAFSAYWANQNTAAVLDVATIVGGTLTNYISTGTSTPNANGVNAWRGWNGPQWEPITSGFKYTLVTGDISGGAVTFRPRVNTAAARSFIHDPGQFSVANLGPAQV